MKPAGQPNTKRKIKNKERNQPHLTPMGFIIHHTTVSVDCQLIPSSQMWFCDRSLHLVKALDEKDHPFSEVVIMVPPVAWAIITTNSPMCPSVPSIVRLLKHRRYARTRQSHTTRHHIWTTATLNPKNNAAAHSTPLTPYHWPTTIT